MAEKLSTVATIGAANESASLPVSGMGGVAIQVQGTFSGTITFEASVQGQDFAPFRVTPSDGTTAVTTATTTGLWVGSTVGYLVVRARMSSYTSGKAIVHLQAELASPGGAGGGGGTGSDVNLIEVGGAAIALGQAAMAASLPVVIASNQTAIPVTGSFSSASVGATGATVPASADYVGVFDPSGNLQGIATEQLDYDTSGSSQPQTGFGLYVPASGGPVAVTGDTANGLDVDVTRLPALVAGSAIIGKVGIDQTTPGTTNAVSATNFPATVDTNSGNKSASTPRVVVATDDINLAAINAVSGTTAGAAVITDANGTIQQYLRGIIKLAITAGGWLASVTGTVADDATTPGNPVMVGGQAKSPDGTSPGNVSAEDDVARCITDLNRRLYVNTNHPQSVPVHLNGSSAYTDQALFPDPGDGFEIVMTSFQCSSGAATAINFFLEEGSTVVFGPIYLEAVAGRGFVSGPINRRFTASTAVTLTSSAAIAQSIDAEYYIQKV